MADSTVSSEQGAPTRDTTEAYNALRHIAIVAVGAVLLGFVMQGLILIGKLASGGVFPGMGLLVDLAQGVTWSFLVCAGVSIGSAIARGRATLAGLLALMVAPVALALARSAQKTMASMVGAAAAPGVLSLSTIGTFRAVEYGILGFTLALLVQRNVAKPWPYLGTGAAVGLLLGGSFVIFTYNAALAQGITLAMPQIVASVINEVIFPIGCSLVIYVGHLVGRNIKVLSQA